MRQYERVASTRLTSGEGHYYFGYYDVPAYSPDERYHLVHRTGFCDRLPKPDDTAMIGLIDRQTGQFTALAETTAWNFQQGAMLQWSPLRPGEEILYNARVEGVCRGVRLDLRTGGMKLLELPIANVAAHGRDALSVSFGRMFAFRPGYGYAGAEDARRHIDAPHDDGVFRIDLETGAARLILSMQQIEAVVRPLSKGGAGKLLINHITFNPDGTRFVMLVRYFPEPGQKWGTSVLTANADGTGLQQLSDGFTMASHYHWRSPDTLLIYANGPAGHQLYEWKDRTEEKAVVDIGYFRGDGHCSYSPDREWILYDSYPDGNRMQHLYLHHRASGKQMTLGSYYAMPAEIDMRCDLHPRWSPSGKRISFDSTHEGSRQVYEMDLSDVIGTRGF